MKKILIAVVVLAGTVSMTSCKKDYTCTCSATDTFYDMSYDLNDYKKKDAESVCDTWDSSDLGLIDGWGCTLN